MSRDAEFTEYLQARQASLLRTAYLLTGDRLVVMTPGGWDKIVKAAPGHVATVRSYVIDVLSPQQLSLLSDICYQILTRLDPQGRVFATFL